MNLQNDVKWYAQSSSMYYSATAIKDLNTNNVERPIHEEFKSDQYLNVKGGPNGIYRYGITNNNIGNETKNYIDFYIQDLKDGYDFHYKHNNREYHYKIYLQFEYGTNKSISLNNFSQYLAITNSQKKFSPIKIKDIFVYKFGHMDLSFGENKGMSYDGNSIGVKILARVDEKNTINTTIRGNLSLDNPYPYFDININPSINCIATISMISNDPGIDKNIFRKTLSPGTTELLRIGRIDNKQVYDDEIKRFKAISQFLNMNEFPKRMQINWESDTADSIKEKIDTYLDFVQNKPNFVVKSKYFSITNEGFILYKNEKYFDYFCIYVDVMYDNKLFPAIIVLNAEEYIIKDNTLSSKGCIDNLLSYKVDLIGFDDKLPLIHLVLSTKEKLTVKINITSTMPFKSHNDHNVYCLDNETLEFTSKD